MITPTKQPAEGRRARRLAGLGAAALFSIAAGAAHAQPQLAAPRPAVTEFRGYALIQSGLEDEIWRLAADGQARMVYSRRGGHAECDATGCDGSDFGTWSGNSGQICVGWRTRTEVSGCYTIVPRAGIHVRLVGPLAFEGTLEQG